MYEEDIPRYKKKAKKKSAAKADHKHRFEPCVFRLDDLRFDEAHGFVREPDAAFSIGTYCPVCGKIGTTINREWLDERQGCWPILFQARWSERARREFDESTRTLPCFYLGDPFANHKYVTLP